MPRNNSRKAIKAMAMLSILVSFGGCATYQPPAPDVPQADLWFRLFSPDRSARLTAGVCDKDERCLMGGSVKLRTSPVVTIRASEIVTVSAQVGTPLAECPTFFLSFKPKEGHHYELRMSYGFNGERHFFDLGYCKAQLVDTYAGPISVVKRRCLSLTGCEPLTPSERDYVMDAGAERAQIRSGPLSQLPTAKLP